MYDNKFGKNFLFSVWTSGAVEVQFQHMRRPPFAAPERRRDLADRLTMIEGVSIPDAALDKRPSFGLQHLVGSGSLDTFLEAFDWVLSEIKSVEVMRDLDDPAGSSEGPDPGEPR
jgi:hypothetical protein